MHQLGFSDHKSNLSCVFFNNFKRQQLFTAFVQNQQLLVLTTKFLDISDILNLSVASQETHKIIQKNTQIQNRVLKAQVSHLSRQQQAKIQSSALYIKHFKPAYSLFQCFPQTFPNQNDAKLKSLYTGQQNISNHVPVLLSYSFLLLNQKLRKLNMRQKKEVKSLKQQINPSIKLMSQKQLIQNDKELKLLNQWELKSRQRSYSEKINKYMSMPENERKKFVIEKLRKNDVPFEQISPPDSSLIVTQVTFWDRLKSKLSQK